MNRPWTVYLCLLTVPRVDGWLFGKGLARIPSPDMHFDMKAPMDAPEVKEASAEVRRLLHKDDSTAMDEAVAAIRAAKRCVVFTGAGASVDSGIS